MLSLVINSFVLPYVIVYDVHKIDKDFLNGIEEVEVLA